MKTILLLTLLPFSARAASTLNQTFTINTPVPDNDPLGMSVTVPISSTITSITNVQVSISLSGGWAGDIYCYLSHDSGFAVLLNRAGNSQAVPDGSGASDLQLTFSDAAAFDIHTAIPASGAVAGTFQPDARTADPSVALDTSPRSAYLTSFNGLAASGDWTIYLADAASGDTMTLNNFSLSVTGIPEPSVALLGLAGLPLALRRKRR